MHLLMSPMLSPFSIILLRELRECSPLAMVPILTVLISAFGPRLSLPGGLDLALVFAEVTSKNLAAYPFLVLIASSLSNHLWS